MYSENFKSEMCKKIHEQMATSIPSKAYYREEDITWKELFAYYIYKDLDWYSISERSCNFSDESDITLKIHADLSIERYKTKSKFVGDIACFFTSQYEWQCGYQSIERSESTIEKEVHEKYKDHGDTNEISYITWSDVQWQVDLLSAASSKLTEDF